MFVKRPQMEHIFCYCQTVSTLPINMQQLLPAKYMTMAINKQADILNILMADIKQFCYCESQYLSCKNVTASVGQNMRQIGSQYTDWFIYRFIEC